eukprot:1009461-Pelagomonas_calceolata.AAC.3
MAASRAPDSLASSQNEQAKVFHCPPQQLASILPAPVAGDGSANSVFSAVTLLMVLVYSLMLFATRLSLVSRSRSMTHTYACQCEQKL